MKILITGNQGIARALAEQYDTHQVTCVSRQTGHDINQISQWGQQFLDYDLVFNNAYDGYGQVSVLEFFFNHWQELPNKTIVTIGSRSSYIPATDTKHLPYWPYQNHKLALQQAHDRMIQSAKCVLKIVNPGPVNTDMVKHLSVPKIDPKELATRVASMVADPAMKRIDLWL